MITGLDRHLGGFVKLGLGDLAGFQHAAKYHVATGKGTLRRADRVQHGRRLGQTGDDGDLVQRQVLDLLAKVNLGGGTDPECPVAERDLVEIELQDLVLGEILLDAPGQEDLFYLAHQRLFIAQEEVAGDLLGDGTGALAGLTGDGPDGGCANDADGVNPRVLIETGIFGRQYCIDHGLGISSRCSGMRRISPNWEINSPSRLYTFIGVASLTSRSAVTSGNWGLM